MYTGNAILEICIIQLHSRSSDSRCFFHTAYHEKFRYPHDIDEFPEAISLHGYTKEKMKGE